MTTETAPRLATLNFDKRRADYARRVAELIALYPKYATKENAELPDYNHIRGALLACNFPMVDDLNLDKAFDAVLARASGGDNGAQAPATTPPPPDDEALTWPAGDAPTAAPPQPAPAAKPTQKATPAQAEPQKSNALQPFGNRAELREFAGRLASMTLPGGKKLSNEEQLALAQVAIAHGLDPFNGEIWIIPGGGIMVGVKGLRKKARQQVRGNFWIDFREIADPDEKARMGIPPEALAYEARLFDTETITTYTDTVGRLLSAKIPWEAVSKMCGEKPYTSGIGFAKPSESSKMTLVARAMKRAEAEALKRRFDIDFGFGVDVAQDEEPQAPGWQVTGPDYEKDAAALWSK